MAELTQEITAAGQPEYQPGLLCVDDDPALLAALSGLLRDCGYRVVATEDPRRAVSLVQSVPIDLAILDYHMPEMNGIELARKIHLSQPAMPVVLFTGDDWLANHDLTGVDGHVVKGSGIEALLQKIRTLLGSRSSQDHDFGHAPDDVDQAERDAPSRVGSAAMAA